MLRFSSVLGFIALTIVASGCSSSASKVPSMPDLAKKTDNNNPVIKDGKGRLVGDEIARYAVNTQPGTSSSVNIGNQRQVFVRVGTDYISATNENCRRIMIDMASGEALVSAVCRRDNIWRTVLLP